MPALSVIMIVKNEAECLAHCLQSVRDIADEIVVADTGSTDDTQAIAARFGARVCSVAWENDFAAARNASIAAATGDWLLHMDADEMLDPEAARRIRALVDADGHGADAIELILANYANDPRAYRWTPVAPNDPYAHGYAGYLRVGLLRLFRNRCGFEYREPVHENITESVLEHGGRIRSEDILIHHYGYDAGKVRSAGKSALYLEIARKKAVQRPNDTKTLHDLAEQALSQGFTDEAEAACRRALAIDPFHLDSATTLANMLLNRGDAAEARTLLENLENAGIAPPHLVTALAALACRDGRLQEAQSRIEAVLQAEPNAILARLYLARLLDRLGRPAEALRELQTLRNAVPGLQEIQDRFRAHQLRTEGERRFSEGHVQEALGCLVEALRLDQEDPYIHNGLGVVLHALGQTAKARESFQRALLLAPGLPEAQDNLNHG